MLRKALILAAILVSLAASSQNTPSIEYERVKADSTWGYLNSIGDTLIPFGKYKFLNPLDEEGMILAHDHSDKKGFINIDDEILIPFVYDDLGVFSMNTTMAQVDGRFGYLNRRGDTIIDFKYEQAGYFKPPGIAVVKSGEGFGIIDTAENTILDLKYEKITLFRDEEIAIVGNNNKEGIFNIKKHKLSEIFFDRIYKSQIDEPSRPCLNCARKTPFNRGIALVENDGEYAIVNKDFLEVVPFGYYDSILPINIQGLAIVLKDGKYGIIDSSGTELYAPKFDFISSSPRLGYEDDFTSFRAIDNGRTTLLNARGQDVLGLTFDSVVVLEHWMYMAIGADKPLILNNNLEIIFNQYDWYHQITGGFIVKNEGKMGIIHEDGTLLLPFIYDSLYVPRFEEHIYAGNNGLYGVINAEGVIVPLEYEFITRTWYNGEEENLIVQKDKKLGTITLQNEVVIPPEYDGLSGWVEYSPDDHYAKLNGKYGMVQPNGEVLVPCIYDYVHYYSRDAILVKKDGLFGILTREGDTVLPIQYESMIVDIDLFHFGGPIDDKIIALQDGKWSYFSKDGALIEGNVSASTIREEYPYYESRVYDEQDMDWILILAK